MSFTNSENSEEIYSKVLRAGRRTYFFDVRETKASDYYLTITESKKFTNDDGTFYFKKHKIYIYKEDFNNFTSMLNETISYIFEQRGEEVISERHQKDYSSDKINSNQIQLGFHKNKLILFLHVSNYYKL